MALNLTLSGDGKGLLFHPLVLSLSAGVSIWMGALEPFHFALPTKSPVLEWY